ncbi:MAG: LAGLIDADG family homing endonuclease [Thaumarchaeota archaeon]|nr:LAGLIDADG family homing endonuclease [Nitrososphaerota archaeon]
MTTEKDYYELVIVPLLRKLYGLTPAISYYHNSIYAIVWSKRLVLFKSEQIGLPVGVKDDLKHLPARIIENGELSIAALLSGLYDADGSVKVRKTTSGNYPRISLAQKSKTIIRDVKMLLWDSFSITSTMYRNDYFDPRVGKTEVRWFLDVNGYPNFNRFVDEIGTRHPNVRSKMAQFP